MNAEPGWYAAPRDPAGTNRYWDGNQWIGDPVLPAVAEQQEQRREGLRPILIGVGIVVAVFVGGWLLNQVGSSDDEHADRGIEVDNRSRILSQQEGVVVTCRTPRPDHIALISALLDPGLDVEPTFAASVPGGWGWYVEAHINDSTGTRLHSAALWFVDGDSDPWALSSNARNRSSAPDGRELASASDAIPTQFTTVCR